jgi:predicted molibdopterin-dependent oxidoreductase YjgC
LLVQDIFLTETAKSVDVVLPAVSFAEKEGSVTNTGIEGMCSKDKKVSRGRLSNQFFR